MIFMWWADCLKQYAAGRILVEAETVEEAREKARFGFKKFLIVERFKRWSPLEPPTPDEDEIEEHDTKVKMFEADIAKDPCGKDTSFFIYGSE